MKNPFSLTFTDGNLRIWGVTYKPNNKFELIRLVKLRGHSVAVTVINVTGNGNFLFSGDGTGKIVKWGLSAETLRAFTLLKTHRRRSEDSRSQMGFSLILAGN